MPAWLVLTLALAADEGPEPWAARVRRFLVTVALFAIGLGVGFGMIGTLTTLVQDWNAPVTLPIGDGTPGTRHNPAGPLLPAFQIFAVVCLGWAAVNLVLLWRSSPAGSPLRARFGWLSASAVLFLLGGGWIVIGSGVYLMVGLPGQVTPASHGVIVQERQSVPKITFKDRFIVVCDFACYSEKILEVRLERLQMLWF